MSKETRTRNGSRSIRALAGVVALFALAAVLPTTMAHNAQATDEHGTIDLSFQMNGEDCEITFHATGIDSATARLRIRTPAGPSGLVPVHEENLTGDPEGDGGTFRYEAGPFVLEDQYYQFELSWDNENHATWQDWGGFYGCAPDPNVRVHQTETSGAVLDIEGCDFFVEGQHVRADSGRVRLSGLYEDDETFFDVTSDDMTAEGDGHGNQFLIPVFVELSGTYMVSFHATGEEFPQASMFFDVTGCSTEPPACPVLREATAESHANVIRWNDVQDAHGYRIYRAEGDGELTLLDEEGHPTGIHQDSSAEAGVTYTYQVTAFNEFGESTDCPTVQVITQGEMQPDECPAVDLTAMANADQSITVTADGLTGPAQLMRASGGGEPEFVAMLDAQNNSYHDTDTEAGVTYTYTLVIDNETCAMVEVTAIPVFPTMVAGVLAMLVGLIGYAVVRRR